MKLKLVDNFNVEGTNEIVEIKAFCAKEGILQARVQIDMTNGRHHSASIVAYQDSHFLYQAKILHAAAQLIDAYLTEAYDEEAPEDFSVEPFKEIEV